MPPTKIVQFCPKWYLNKYFYQSALSWGEKCKYVAQELCLFVQKRQFTDFCTVNTWTRHQRSLSTFTFNFLELSNDTFNDSSFFNRPYFVPIITKEPVWFSSILFYCQLASYRWRTFVNSVNYKILKTMTFLHPFCCLSMIMSDVRFLRKKLKDLKFDLLGWWLRFF